MGEIDKKRLNRVTRLYAGVGLVVSLALVLLQEHVLGFWVFSEAATVVGVMTVVIGYAARAAYKAGRSDARGEVQDEAV